MILDPWFWGVIFGGCAVHWLLPLRARPWLVVALSVGYLLSLSVTSVVLAALLGIVVFFVAPIAAARPELRKRLTTTLLALLVGSLVVWKYGPEGARAIDRDSWLAAVALPIGLSFYAFRLVHYALEVSRGTLKERHAATFFSYLFLLPIYTAGPIEQYEHFSRNIEKKPSLKSFSYGLARIVAGLFKKLLLADALITDRLLNGLTMEKLLHRLPAYEPHKVWGFLVLFLLYNYMDFGGYSDIAIGTSKLFGFNISENFNWPLIARNIGEFWKRWHMTLAGWTQRYVYMPLIARTRNPYFAVYATFVVMGLWHSASVNYLCWGLYHGTGVSVALTWARYKRQRGWEQAGSGLLRYWGVPVTFAFICGSSIFSATNGFGVSALLRIAARAFALG